MWAARPTNDANRRGSSVAWGRFAAARQRLGQHPARRGSERWILPEDLGLEIPQLGSGFQSELVGKDRAGLLVGAQGVGLAILAIADDHQQRPPPLDQRLGNDQSLEFRGGRLDLASVDAAFEPGCHRRLAHREQTCRRRLPDREVGNIFERSIPPQRQRLVELRHSVGVPPGRGSLATDGHQSLETMSIELRIAENQVVRRSDAFDRYRCNRLAQLRDHGLQSVGRRRPVGPQNVVEHIDRRRPRSVKAERCQGTAQLRASNRDRRGVVVDKLQWPQDAQLHRVREVTRSSGPGQQPASVTQGTSASIALTLMSRPHVVIIGSGFGGIRAAKGLAGSPVDVTIIDANNFHTFQPLLYQVATAGLDADDIGFPIRGIFRRNRSIRFVLGEVVGIDLHHHTVRISDDRTFEYDYLIIAAGSDQHIVRHRGRRPAHVPLEDAARRTARCAPIYSADSSVPAHIGAPTATSISGS